MGCGLDTTELDNLHPAADPARPSVRAPQALSGDKVFQQLDGSPRVDVLANVQAALATGVSVTRVPHDVVALRPGAGKLAPHEYLYYRLWHPGLDMAGKRRFVGT